MNVFVLDFDGVLCDSAAECAVTSWRAGRHLWPDWSSPEPPVDCLERFIALRPVIETGYQTIPLMRLVKDGLSDEAITADFTTLCDQVLTEVGCSRVHSNRLFGQTRDAWIAQNPADWLARQRFYPTVFEAFTAKLAATEPVFILTTKEERFVDFLLRECGIRFLPQRLFGLDRGKKKEEVLEQLLQDPDLRGAAFHFVEDRLETLLRVAGRKSLEHIRLYLAAWGYTTPADCDHARRTNLITVWSPEAFLAV